MVPDPARSRVERSGRLAGCPRGYTLLEALFVVSLMVTLAGISVPVVLSTLDASRTRGAARYLSGRLNLARMEAVKRSEYVALRIESEGSTYRLTFYRDGNRNGVLTRDIAGLIDEPIGPSEHLEDKFPGVVFGILPGVIGIDESGTLDPAGDPIKFGRSDLLSFSPFGTATAGTFYLHGRGQQQMAVRVLGTTGRVRMLWFDFNSHQWVEK
jgi:hypothetical protein